MATSQIGELYREYMDSMTIQSDAGISNINFISYDDMYDTLSYSRLVQQEIRFERRMWLDKEVIPIDPLGQYYRYHIEVKVYFPHKIVPQTFINHITSSGENDENYDELISWSQDLKKEIKEQYERESR